MSAVAMPNRCRPGVTAIVLNWCGEEETAACLRSLAECDYPALRVLLVDNASPDGSGERLRAAFPQLDYLQTGENGGYTRGNNLGIERALDSGCEYVLVLNNDTIVEPAAVSRLVETAQGGDRVGAVGPKILYADEPARIWFGGGDFSRMRAVGVHRFEGELDSDPHADVVEEVEFLTGCCLLLPAAVLQEVGGFEEDFFAYVEDVDLSLRLHARGYRLLYQPAARLLHRISREEAEPTPFQLLHAVRNRRRLVRRRYRRMERLWFGLFFYPSRVVQIARYLGRRDLARARAIWQGMRSP